MKSAFPVDQFIRRAAADAQLLPSHVALFMAIFHYSPEGGVGTVFQVSRSKLMQFSKIRANATYHKCLGDLVRLGYIAYEPSFDPFMGSKVQILLEEDK